MRLLFLSLILFFSILLGFFTTIPVVLGVLLVLYVYNRNAWIFFVAFISGLLLDFVLLKTVGITSLIFVTFVFLIDLYEKKFEIKTTHFILFFSFIGSLVYLEIYRQNYALQQAIINSLIAVLIFKVFGRMERKRILTD